ncbi:hypothetical protein C1646_794773 [Rhizophagus diaphanus]|nr:hypothetical protein C1646_794773 [Rhizophagus diaphanus] [Rhizophagus sp. MUCL 43196]
MAEKKARTKKSLSFTSDLSLKHQKMWREFLIALKFLNRSMISFGLSVFDLEFRSVAVSKINKNLWNNIILILVEIIVHSKPKFVTFFNHNPTLKYLRFYPDRNTNSTSESEMRSILSMIGPPSFTVSLDVKNKFFYIRDFRMGKLTNFFFKSFEGKKSLTHFLTLVWLLIETKSGDTSEKK